MKPKQGTYIIGLDHLRALAAFLVFFWHGIHVRDVPFVRDIPFDTVPSTWVGSLFEEGWSGVTLFITITGFVFTVLTAGKQIDFLPFLKNRVLRLFPLIFLMTLYAVHAIGSTNTSLFLFFGLLGGGTVYGTWTLAVEFQFYLAYPFLRNTLEGSSATKTVLRCALFCGLFLMLRYIFFIDKGEVRAIAYWTILGQADAFIAGILAGHVFNTHRHRHERSVRAVSVVVLVAAGTSLVGVYHWLNIHGGFYGDAPDQGGVWVYLPTVTAALWACVVGSYTLLAQRLFGPISRALGYIGAISYSTYMLHFLTVPMCNYLYGEYVGFQFSEVPIRQMGLTLLTFHYPVTLLVSAVSYELIEKAFLRKRVPYLLDPEIPALQKPVIA
ncbi:acyltransferase family protein [Aurantimonas endophytica]|uniref:Peptidoglycan/LPS O-acetylase OafA/YrhL n=1 Tax=Aurantimonas endophytica TaxID=1522175 RepID=A0A7W6H997_9HYPH|nr:peptidoglycan/LPS O-acetylase OafA/YrhL [Aurantimonas endophytica]MCO6403356.1 acyltransferase family protein [Aurantimonas endophytica]